MVRKSRERGAYILKTSAEYGKIKRKEVGAYEKGKRIWADEDRVA
jgi:hypothetical protein